MVRATGEGVISIRPDQAKVNVGVVTNAATAEEASNQNATQTEAVIKALTGVLGSASPIRTGRWWLCSTRAPCTTWGPTASK